jgi:hypothetical protein
MNPNQDIYLRAHTVQLASDKNKDKSRTAAHENDEPRWPDYALVFDCETRITSDQTLTFGTWRFCELRDGIYIPLEEGIFHNGNNLKPKELDLLRKYARGNKPETASDGCDRLRLYFRAKFIEEVFGMAMVFVCKAISAVVRSAGFVNGKCRLYLLISCRSTRL